MSESKVALPFYNGTEDLLVVGLFCPDCSDWRQGTANESLIRSDNFDSWQSHYHYSLEKKEKKCSESSALDMACDKSQVCSLRPLIGDVQASR